jgi:hypothetical protein
MNIGGPKDPVDMHAPYRMLAGENQDDEPGWPGLRSGRSGQVVGRCRRLPMIPGGAGRWCR